MDKTALLIFGKTPKAAMRFAMAILLSVALSFAMPVSQIAYAAESDSQTESSLAPEDASTEPEASGVQDDDSSEAGQPVQSDTLAAPSANESNVDNSADSASKTGSDQEATGQEGSGQSSAENDAVTPAETDGALVQVGDFYRYLLTDGTYLKNDWKEIEGEKYYFGANYNALIGMQEIDGALYFFNEKGQAVKGWKTISGKNYYFDPETYQAAKYKKVIEGKLYYFNAKCEQRTGWVTWNSDSRKTYFAPAYNGAAAKGWWKIAGKRYYFDDEYKAVKYKQTIEGKLYYFNAKCEQRTGWVTWNSDSRKTYFHPDRKGAAAKGWWTIKGKRYYFDDEYKAVKGKQTIKGKLYYFNAKCEQYKGWIRWSSDSRRTYFHPDRGGAAAKGWWWINSKRYYFDSNCKAVRYKKVIDGKTYYFNAKGQMQTGWVRWSDGTHSYFGSNGVMYTGTRVVDGVTYKFGSNGKTTADIPTKAKMKARAQQYKSPTNWLILVDRTHQYVGIFYGEQYAWELKKYWICSTGLPGRTATPLGSNHAIGYRGHSFGDATFTCYWYTQFYKRCLFHSSPYVPGTSIIMDGTMGVPSSHGCIRLYINRAKWIYDNIPRDTRVVIYK